MIKHTMLLVVALGSLAFASCGGGSSNSAATAAEFCNSSASIICDKVFQCVPAAARDASFTALFGNNASECKTLSKSDCSNAAADCPTYDAATGKTCLDKLGPLTCAQIGDSAFPSECDSACM